MTPSQVRATRQSAAKGKVSRKSRGVLSSARLRHEALIDEEHKTNLESLCANFDALDESAYGKYALMHQGYIVGIYGDAGEAVREGLSRFPDRIFSVQQIIPMPVRLGGAANAAV